MNFFQFHLRKYWPFLVFIGVLIGIAFLYFHELPFDFSSGEIWGQIAIGFFIGFVIAFIIAGIYEALVPETFQKARIFYLLMLTIIPTLYSASYASETIAIIVVCFFWLAVATSVIGVIIRLWKNPGALVFHFVGLFLWFLFLALYYINIKLSYEGC